MFWLLLLSQSVFCQLNNFNLSVTSTDETCPGNGSILMSVSNTNPDAEIIYTLFLYPETGTPIAQTTSDAFSNLNSGDYLVEARQTLGNSQNSQTADATINDLTMSLDFDVNQFSTGDCDTANLEINILSGIALSYEIISGPVTIPSQSNNTFNDLPTGTYVIRVFDICNNALTKTYTLLLANDTFSLGAVELPDVLENCIEITLTNVITTENSGVLSYPFVVNYTVFPPDGSMTLSYSSVYESGAETELIATQLLPVFDDQIFDIEIAAQDRCGNSMLISQEIDPNPKVNMITTAGACGNNFNIQVENFLPPYNLEFIEAPMSFTDPGTNQDPDGTYSVSLLSFGQNDTSLPLGFYSVIVTDACGRIGTGSLELTEEEIEPFVTPANGGCNPLLGSLIVNIPNREIVTATFTSAPGSYEEPLPSDVSDSITTNGLLVVDPLPAGDYILEMIDECGIEYLIEVSIPALVELPVSIFTSPNCTTETGTLRIASPYGDIESVIITDAPASFSFDLPYDYSAEILAIGVFYVGNLPEGIYSLECVDSCGNVFAIDQFVATYTSNPSIYNLQRNCGSFDLGIFDGDVSVYDQSYWFQKYNPETESWEHPFTGIAYSEGEMPNNNNSVEIENEETIFNIFITGKFRLIKAFQPFNNPNPGERCYDIFGEFEVVSDLTIKGVYNLNCDGGSGPSDVLIDVLGVPPYNFSIVSPVVIDNGTNNVFSNLSPGIYQIKVEDVCGSIETISVNLEDLLPVVNIGIASNLVACSDSLNDQIIFDLAQQNSQLIGNQNPGNLTLSYHLSQDDADTGENAIATTHENSTNPQTIYVRMEHNTLDICFETSSFQLIVNALPDLEPDETITICDGSTAILSTSLNVDNYTWSTGETTPSITVSDSGSYTLTVAEIYGDVSCETSKTFTVNMSSIAIIEAIVTEDFSQSGNTISIEVSGFGDYEYSLDGIFYQPDPNFTNLQTGEYTVYVRDKNGCGVATETIFLLNYKKFFTPNGDGDNEYWQISGSQFEPSLKINIHDRYGKLLTSFRGDNVGWDGTYNGQNMPTNDYWFVIKRSNGDIFKGHFTLKR
ncbi:MAG: T9SS type B sorting domain-containing protein [Psychroserpens sp.]|uniref:T9SS type B sorting domain-containing protein n=2 Tax=Psychroserpens sp. TaxID=2020870 RepID=UPI003CBA8736